MGCSDMACFRNWLSESNCFRVLCLWKSLNSIRILIFVWTEIIIVKYFHIKLLDEISASDWTRNEWNHMKYNFCSFEWSNEYSIDGNIRATDEKLLRITSYGRLNRSIMRYRRTPTSISPWWFVKMESLLSSVYLREHQLSFKPLLPTIRLPLDLCKLDLHRYQFPLIFQNYSQQRDQ